MPKEEETDKITERLESAIELATQLHGKDSRKGSPVPYMAHLLSVCAMVQMDGGEEDEAIAALLHDALEDKPDQISPEEITRRYGNKVIEIIRISSDTPEDYTGGEKPPWKDRKLAYLEQVYQTDPSLLRVTVADKVDNARAILADHQHIGDELWGRFNAVKEEILWYYSECAKAYGSVGFSGPLLDELDRLVYEMQLRVNAS